MNVDERAARDAWKRSETGGAARKGTLVRLARHLRQGHVSWRRFSACSDDEEAVAWLAACRSSRKIRLELDAIARRAT